jgi:hypothetical protein
MDSTLSPRSITSFSSAVGELEECRQTCSAANMIEIDVIASVAPKYPTHYSCGNGIAHVARRVFAAYFSVSMEQCGLMK